jgi:hypothetical protein
VLWQAAACSGAGGGLIVSAVAFFTDVLAWQEERHKCRRARVPDLPGITQFMDPSADLLALFTRILLGSTAGYVFHDEVIGNTAAIAVGAAAPALLTQFGKRPFPDLIPETQTKPPGDAKNDRSAEQPMPGEKQSDEATSGLGELRCSRYGRVCTGTGEPAQPNLLDSSLAGVG